MRAQRFVLWGWPYLRDFRADCGRHVPCKPHSLGWSQGAQHNKSQDGLARNRLTGVFIITRGYGFRLKFIPMTPCAKRPDLTAGIITPTRGGIRHRIQHLSAQNTEFVVFILEPRSDIIEIDPPSGTDFRRPKQQWRIDPGDFKSVVSFLVRRIIDRRLSGDLFAPVARSRKRVKGAKSGVRRTRRRTRKTTGRK